MMLGRQRHANATCQSLAALFLFWGLASASIGQTDEVQFRRVEVPLTEIQSFVGGYVPRSREDFERLVAAPRKGPRPFVTARHRVELVDGTLQGAGELKKVASTPANSFLELGGDLALRNPFWQQEKQKSDAIVGRVGSKTVVANNADADTLTVEWTQQGIPLAGDDAGSRFELRLPDALVHELLIRLPTELQLLANRGVVLQSNQEEVQTESEDTLTIGEVWTVHWSGKGAIALTILPKEIVKEEIALDVHYDASYFIRPGAIRSVTMLKLLPNPELPHPNTFKISADPRLKLNSISSLGKSLDWTRAAESVESVATYEIEMPPLSKVEEALSVRVDASFELTVDELIELPRLRVEGRWASEQVHWTTKLPMEVVDVQGQDFSCEAIDVTQKNAESMRFLLESEDAILKLHLAHDAQETVVESFVRATLEEKGIVLDVEARFEPLGSDVFELLVDVDLAAGWSFDPPDVLADTSVLNLPASVMDRYESTKIGDRERLRVFLRQAATSDKPATLKIRLRNDSMENAFSTAELLPISFPNVSRIEHWVYVGATPGLEVTLQDVEHTKWASPESPCPDWMSRRIAAAKELESLDPSEVLSHESLAEDLLWKHNDVGAPTRIVRKSKTALLRVDASVQLDIDSDSAVQMYEWNINPLGESVDHIDIRFSHPLADLSNATESEWSFSDRGTTPTVAAMGTDASFSRYRVSFDATSEPFQLRLQLTNALEDFVPLPLVEQTSIQKVTVALFASGSTGLDVERDEDLRPVPLGSIEDALVSNDIIIRGRKKLKGGLRAAYSYDDASARIPTLKVVQQEIPIQSALVAWRCDVRSFYSEKGRPRHRADFYLQNDGAARFQLNLPLDYALEDVEVDGQKLNPQPRLAGGMLSLVLPSSNRFPCVSVRYVQPERSLGAIDWVKPPMQMSPLNDGDVTSEIQPDIPWSNVSCLQTTWQIWLPRDYQTYSSTLDSNRDGWKERIFGSFGSANGPTFGAATWRSLRRRLVPDNNNSSIVDQTKGLLGSDWFRTSGAASEGTWGGRLRRVKRAIRRSRGEFSLLVDREEMRRLGIFPTTELPNTRYTQARQMGMDRLVQAGLAIVFDGDRAILTSASEVKERTSRLDLIGDIAVEGRRTWFPASRLQDIDEWEQNVSDELWQPSTDPLEIGFQQGGWVSSRRIVDNDARPLKIYHRDTATALACSLFFIGLSLGWRSYPNRVRWSLLLVVSFVLALLLPRPGATLAIAFAWATVLSGLAHFVAHAMSQQPVTSDAKAPSAAIDVTRVVSVLLVVCLALGSDEAAAQATERFGESEAASAVSAASAVITEATENFVYLPYTDDRQPTNFVYVSPDFDQILNRRKQDLSVQPSYLFRRATYSGVWSSDTEQKWLPLTVELQFTTFVDFAEVKLPFEQQIGRFVWDQTSLKLDRREVAAEDDVLQVGRAGNHRLKINGRARITRRGETLRIGFAIPSLPTSRLKLGLPRSVRSVELPSQLSKTTSIDIDRGVVDADFGASNQLGVQMQMPRPSNEPKDDVDQLILLTIGNGQVRQETRFRFSGAKTELKMKVDKRLTPTFESKTYGNWNEDEREFSLDLLGSTASEDVRFLPIPSSVGRFRVPLVAPTDVTIRKTHLAIVTSNDVVATPVVDSSDATALSRDEFTEVWGEMETLPDVMLAIQQDSVPHLQIVHAERVENWSSEIAFYFDAAQTEFEANVQLIPTGAARTTATIRRLRVPTALTVRTVEASTTLGVPLRIRWRRHGDELVLFFLDGPEISQAVPIKLAVSGVLEGAAEQLPLLSPLPSQSTETQISQSVVLFSAENVELQLEAPLSMASNADDTDQRTGYQYAGSWNGELRAANSEPLSLRVSKRIVEADLQGSLTTRLSHDADGWLASVTAEVNRHEFDAIHFDVPRVFTEKSLVATDSDGIELGFDVRGGAGLDRRIVTVWFATATSKVIENQARTVTLSARLPAEQTRLPHVELRNVRIIENDGQRQQFVELPSRSSNEDNSHFAWRLRGLSVVSDGPKSVYSERYRVTQTDFDAELTEVKSGIRPEVLLLETTASWRTERNQFFAMSQFDLKPASLNEVFVKLPAASEVIQLMCDDVPTLVEAVNDESSRELQFHQVFRVPLPAAPWPQRIRVIYRVSPRQSGRRLVLQAPQLFASDGTDEKWPVPVRTKLWKVYAPHDSLRTFRNAEKLTQSEVDNLVVSSFSELWTNSQVSLRERREEKAAWLRTWAGRLQGPVNRLREQAEWTSDPNMQTINELMTDYSDVFESELTGGGGAARGTTRYDELWDESQWISGEFMQCASSDSGESSNLDLPSLQIEYTGSSYDTLWMRFFVAVMLVGCVVLLSRVSALSQLGEIFQQVPHVALVVLGIAWWIFLKPAWLGLAILLVVAILWAVLSFRKRRLILPS